jgi:hypothetical protein
METKIPTNNPRMAQTLNFLVSPLTALNIPSLHNLFNKEAAIGTEH